MLCERCKEREARVRFTEVFNGKVTEHNLCLECARTTAMSGQNYAALLNGENPLGRLLSGLLSMAGKMNGADDNPLGEQVSCPVCNTSYGEFVRDSRFGCADCYEVFELLMEDHIKNLQGSSSHRGKRPMKKRSQVMSEAAVDPFAAGNASEAQTEEEAEGNSLEERIEELQQQLQVALLEEEYEEAARIRDEIRALKRELEEKQDGQAGNLKTDEMADSPLTETMAEGGPADE